AYGIRGVVVGDDFVSIGPNKSPRGVKEGQIRRESIEGKRSPVRFAKAPSQRSRQDPEGRQEQIYVCTLSPPPLTEKIQTIFRRVREQASKQAGKQTAGCNLELVKEAYKRERERDSQVLGFVQTGSRGGLEVSPGTDV
ncbi:hypothetical protein OIY81_3673, partial [Cryptosporidium canis]